MTLRWTTATLCALLVLGCQGVLGGRPGDRPAPADAGPQFPPLPDKEPETDAGGVPPVHDAGPIEDMCAGLDFRGRCDGQIISWCGRDGRIHTRDCSEHGLVCGWLDDETGHWCMPGADPPPPPPGDGGAPPPPPPGDAGTDAGSSPPPPTDAGTPMPPPTIGAPTCRTWGEQQSASNASWGSVLTDIVRHLPSSYGSTYYDADHITYGHETSHGIHSHIRNYLNDTGSDANGFYVPGGRACLVREPMMRKSHVAAYVPSNLRGSRYSLYISGSTAWDDTPLYVWDEWNAYVNGAEVGLQRSATGLWTSGWRGTVDGVIEFVVYGVAVGMAAETQEPGYFAREPNFLAFMAMELERSMTAFRAGQTDPLMRWDTQDQFYERLRTSSEAASMRDWIRAKFGAAWTTRVMGF